MRGRLLIFVEGTRSRDGTMHRAEAGGRFPGAPQRRHGPAVALSTDERGVGLLRRRQIVCATARRSSSSSPAGATTPPSRTRSPRASLRCSRRHAPRACTASASRTDPAACEAVSLTWRRSTRPAAPAFGAPRWLGRPLRCLSLGADRPAPACLGRRLLGWRWRRAAGAAAFFGAGRAGVRELLAADFFAVASPGGCRLSGACGCSAPPAVVACRGSLDATSRPGVGRAALTAARPRPPRASRGRLGGGFGRLVVWPQRGARGGSLDRRANRLGGAGPGRRFGRATGRLGGRLGRRLCLPGRRRWSRRGRLGRRGPRRRRLGGALGRRVAAALPGAGGDGLTLAAGGAPAQPTWAWPRRRGGSRPGPPSSPAAWPTGMRSRTALCPPPSPAALVRWPRPRAAAGRGAGARRAGAGGGSSRGAGGRGTPRSTATGCAAVEPVVRRTGTGGAGGTGGPSPRPITPSAVSRQVKATTSLMSAARSNRTIAVWLSTVSTRPREPTG